jgi:tripartite-type tricarboxylate transporter receptor subunit TctC
VQVGFTTTRAIVALAAGGKLRALATTDWKRSVQLPQVPTIAEAGFTGLEGLAPYSFFGLVGPARLPAVVVSRLNDAVNRISALPEVAAQMRDTLMIEPTGGTPAEFRQFIEKETVKWREIGKSLDLKD